MDGVGNKRETQMPIMSASELIKATGGSLIFGWEDAVFSSVSIDSRKTSSASLFVALKGENQDGHIFIEDSLKAGSSLVLLSSCEAEKNRAKYEGLFKDYGATFISVDNTLFALQTASKFYLEKIGLSLKIGVTGSSGKTTVKELLGAIFSKLDKTFVSFGNLNSETGLPLSIFELRSEHRIGVFEMGMNRKGEIAELSAILRPDVAVITNIGTAHVGMLGNIENIAKEKKEIFSHFSSHCVGFVPEGEFAQFLKDVPEGKMVLVSKELIEGFEGAKMNGIEGSIIRYKDLDISLHLLGKHNIQNAICAIAVAQYFGVSKENIKSAIESVRPPYGRSEVKKGFTTCFFDCYNANPASVQEAIEFCDVAEDDARHVYILGSMKELGEMSQSEHAKICQKAFASRADLLFLFGSEMLAGFFAYLAEKKIDYNCNSHYIESIEGREVFFYNDSEFENLKDAIKKNVKKKDFVLLKASRSLSFERLQDVLL